jgi:cytochrome P450
MASFVSSMLGDSKIIWVLIAVIATFFYISYSRTFRFFSRRGIPGPTPLPYFGNLLTTLRRIVPELEIENYKTYGKVYGYFEAATPILNVADPELIKDIMIRKFNHFVDRRDQHTNHRLFRHFLPSLKGDEWRRARNTMTPTFTSGKMKAMMTLMTDCTDDLLCSLTKKAESDEGFNAKDIFGFFTMDVVARCAFATKTNVQEMGYESTFMRNASLFLAPTKRRMFLRYTVPQVVLSFLMKSMHGGHDVIEYLERIIRNIIAQRKSDDSKRSSYKDLLQLLMEAAKNEKKIETTDEEVPDTESHHGHDDKSLEESAYTQPSKHMMSDDEVIANALIVLAAGYETTATLLTYASYSLAKNQDVQDRLRDEIKKIYEGAGNKIKYEDLSSIPYLDAVITETLRMYPPVIRTERCCTRDHSMEAIIDGKKVKLYIKEGDNIRFPTYAIHHDPNNYPEPEKFKPERFLEENRHKLIPYTYLPFGAGPRNCIGMRFALLEAKLALAKTLLNFRIVSCAETPTQPDFSSVFILLSPQNIIVKVEKL